MPALSEIQEETELITEIILCHFEAYYGIQYFLILHGLIRGILN